MSRNWTISDLLNLLCFSSCIWDDDCERYKAEWLETINMPCKLWVQRDYMALGNVCRWDMNISEIMCNNWLCKFPLRPSWTYFYVNDQGNSFWLLLCCGSHTALVNCTQTQCWLWGLVLFIWQELLLMLQAVVQTSLWFLFKCSVHPTETPKENLFSAKTR